MTLQQLDEVLKNWKAKLSAIAENLLELQSDSTYQSLTGTGGFKQVALAGATAARVGVALRSMNDLFLRFGLLQATIDRAEEIRSGLPSLFGSEVKHRAIEQLLFTRCIELQASEVPLTERQLLGGSSTSESFTPQELLDFMTRTFAEIRDIVADIGQAWTEFATCNDRVEREIGRLRSQTAMPSRLLAPMLDIVEARLAATCEQMRADPVGALGLLHASVESALASANERVLVSERMSVQIRSARGRLQALRLLHEEAAAARVEAMERLGVAADEIQAVSEQKLEALGEWLDRLDRKFDEGAIDPIAVGLRNWLAATEQMNAQDRAVLSTCKEQLALQNELRGRLDALKAKARAYAPSGSGEISALCSTAETMLHTSPVDLRRAGEAVARYEQRLREARVPNELDRGLVSR